MIGWILAMILLPVALTEFGEVAPWLARRYVGWAAGRLPTERMRQRYGEEWRGELERVPGNITKLGFAFGVALVVPQLRWQVRAGERQVPGLRDGCERAIASLELVDESMAAYQKIADTVKQAMGFQAVALNVCVDDEGLMCVATAGPEEMRDALLGNICGRVEIENLLAQGDAWGQLRFLASIPDTADVTAFVPEQGERKSRDPEIWRPEYNLISPLRAPDGEFLGIFSLDCPVGGQIPGRVQRELVETYSDHVAKAISEIRRRTAHEAKSAC